VDLGGEVGVDGGSRLNSCMPTMVWRAGGRRGSWLVARRGGERRLRLLHVWRGLVGYWPADRFLSARQLPTGIDCKFF
jgi:hypothetical protein